MRIPSLLAALLILTACSDPVPEGRVAVTDALGGAADPGFARVLAPRPFEFPRDHGPHPQYRHEWWYVTGNLAGRDGKRFGFQVTFFRFALAPPEETPRPSRWATREVWMAHAALTDVAAGTHRARERFARGGALQLAGARAEPFAVWLEDWRLEAPVDGGGWRLALDAGEFALDLGLEALRPPLPQGDDGLSQKSPEPGNASHYYSLTRLAARGTVRTDDGSFSVEGLAWLDREWGTSALGPDQAGWDWFSLQLADGTDLMYYRLRRTDGSPDPHSRGTLLRADGTRLELLPGDLELTPLDSWVSPGGQRYPVAWDLHLRPLDRRLRVRGLLPDQLMDLSVRYWEGAVEVTEDGRPAGYGYLEMTGY